MKAFFPNNIKLVARTLATLLVAVAVNCSCKSNSAEKEGDNGKPHPWSEIEEEEFPSDGGKDLKLICAWRTHEDTKVKVLVQYTNEVSGPKWRSVIVNSGDLTIPLLEQFPIDKGFARRFRSDEGKRLELITENRREILRIVVDDKVIGRFAFFTDGRLDLDSLELNQKGQ